MRKLSGGQIQVGKPIPYDCYDGNGQLLLKKGLVVDSQRQVDFLLERGLYGQAEASGGDATPVNDRPASPFELISDCYNRLSRLLSLPSAQSAGASPPLAQPIQALAADIQKLCRLDADAVLGAVHLDHAVRYGVMHPVHRAIVCEMLARRKAVPEDERLQIVAAALSADISMIKLQDELARQKEQLQPQQRLALHQHPLESLKLLTVQGVVNKTWLTAVVQHHEACNGKGYPSGVAAGGISQGARILKLADMYTALIAPRAQRAGAISKVAMRELYLKRGEEVDEELALLLIKELGVFPPGAFVKLYSGELAIVTRRTDNPKAPAAKAVVGPRGAPYERPAPRKTEIREYEIVGVVERDKIVAIDLHNLWGYTP
ncbi:MAG: hypothetical protein IV097_02025 [Burkholderiaceae bacterium]|nr:hypothetical protein [Burkholderiaceae bacterium]